MFAERRSKILMVVPGLAAGGYLAATMDPGTSLVVGLLAGLIVGKILEARVVKHARGMLSHHPSNGGSLGNAPRIS
jgi:hypothetical protein